jgi:hypothetical protein
MKKNLLLLLFISPFFSEGQDIRGGEAQYQCLGGNTYLISAILYTETSVGIDHWFEVFHTGDGSSDTLPGIAFTTGNGVTMWSYTFTHTYSGNGTYNLYLMDSSRVASIQNINNSSAETITLSSLLILNPNFTCNNSVTFSSPQTSVDVAGGYFIHNPMAYDSDGDSLSFSLIPTTSTNYSPPPGITIDPALGIVQMPLAAGKWAINIKIDEWRILGGNPFLIGTTYREMILDSSAVVGVEEINTNEGLNIYPNPAHSSFSITSPFQNARVEIYNVVGEKVFQTTLNSKKQTLNASLSTGLYFVKVQNGEKVNVEKLVIE